MFNFNEHLQELRKSIVGIGLLLATTTVGLVWITIGLYSWLTSLIGAVWGPILLGFLLLMPLFIYALIKLFSSKDAQQQTHQFGKSYADDSILNISRVIESLSGQSPLLVTLVAVVAGFLATRFPAILSVFTQVVTAYAEDVKARAAKHTEQTVSQSDELVKK